MKNVKKQMQKELRESSQFVYDYAIKVFLYARRMGASNADVNYASEKNIKFCISQIVRHSHDIIRILL